MARNRPGCPDVHRVPIAWSSEARACGAERGTYEDILGIVQAAVAASVVSVSDDPPAL